MHVSVDIPDQKTGLDAAIAKQFADIHRSLLKLIDSKERDADSMQKMMMAGMEDQQDTLVAAMERLMAMVQQVISSSKPSQGMMEAVRSITTTLKTLPEILRERLDHQRQSSTQMPLHVSVKPNVTVEMPSGLVNRLDSLEASLLNGLRRSRSRTFGSNY